MIQVVILAAGRGKRMEEWTETNTKAMLPLNDENGKQKKPMLHITIERFVKAGFYDFIIVVGYRKNDIIDYFGDGKNFGASIKYVTQKNVCAGTADAVNCTKFFFEGYDQITNGSPFFLIYADIVPTVQDILDLTEKYIDSHELCTSPSRSTRLQRCLAVMGVRRVDDPQRYGVVELDDNENITRIVEKSPNPPTNLINAGIYILPVEIFEHIKNTPLSERGEYELTESIQRLINSGGVVKYQPVTNVQDIGTKVIYETALENLRVNFVKPVITV